MQNYEVVYSAALERQGKGLTLSGHCGPSTLKAFEREEPIDDVKAIQRVCAAGHLNRRQIVRRHAFRSTWL